MKAKGAIIGENARMFAERAKKKDFTKSIIKNLLPELKPNKKMKVVDFCTGSGNIIPFFKDKVNEFTAVEASSEMVKIMESEFGNVKNLKIIQSDVSKVPLESDKYDAVICKFSLHHISEAAPVFKEAFRILKKRGRLFIIDVVFEGNLFDRIKIPFLKIKQAFEKGYHELFCRYRTNKDIIDLFERNNFKILKKERLGQFRKYNHFYDYFYVGQK